MTHKTIVVFESDWEFVTGERDRLRAELDQIKAFFRDSPSADWYDYTERHDPEERDSLREYC